MCVAVKNINVTLNLANGKYDRCSVYGPYRMNAVKGKHVDCDKTLSWPCSTDSTDSSGKTTTTLVAHLVFNYFEFEIGPNIINGQFNTPPDYC